MAIAKLFALNANTKMKTQKLQFALTSLYDSPKKKKKSKSDHKSKQKNKHFLTFFF